MLENNFENLNNFQQPDTNQICKFKFEQGGMLVYDIKAALFKLKENNIPTAFPSISSRSKVSKIPQSDTHPSEDFELLEKVKKMPAMPDFPISYNLYIPDDGVTLQFNSKFESGNLLKSIKLSDYEYNLMIRSDIHSTGNNHWFYFSVYNPRRTSVKFNIINMKKNDGLFRLGMKPAVYSTVSFQLFNQGWHRDGASVSYKSRSTSETFFTLSFTYSFKHEADLVYFAYSVPYTYPELQEYLQGIKEKHSKIARVDKLCDSLAGNSCDILTITSNIESYVSHQEETEECKMTFAGRKLKRIKKSKLKLRYLTQHNRKKGIFFTARVHSGETVSSFMIQGVINFLLSDSKKARVLREQFVFKIVPMLNPDGVRYGNYRCSLLGVDLNRRWDLPNKQLHPTVFHTKKILTAFNERHPVSLFCDFHGHTKKQNVFMYGCSSENHDLQGKRQNMCVKVLPVLMESNKFFSFKDCHFRIESSKLSTARVVVFQELNIMNSYTLESSFFGPKAGEHFLEGFQMESCHYCSIGESICEILPIFISEGVFYKKLRYVSEYLAKLTQVLPKQEVLKDLPEVNETRSDSNIVSNISENQWEMIKLVEYEDDEDSGGSESSPDERSPEKRSKSNSKPRVSYQKLYKQREKASFFKNFDNLKPLDRSKKRFVIHRKSMLAERDEKSKSDANIDCDKKKIFNPPANILKKIEMRFEFREKDGLGKDRERGSELPKIHSDPKGVKKLSPQNYNFINYSWVEDYSHKIANSTNQKFLLSRNTVFH